MDSESTRGAVTRAERERGVEEGEEDGVREVEKDRSECPRASQESEE